MSSKILVIDNDLMLGRTIKNVLTNHEYVVYVAPDSTIGIQMAFKYHPDLILCGINITPIDGYHLFNILKESSLTDYIPFIFITTKCQLEDIRYGMSLGADDYFFKPIDYDQLIRSIENRLTKYNNLKEHAKYKFSTLFNLSPNCVFLSDGQFILDANDSMLEVLGYSKKEITKVKISEIFHNGFTQTILERIKTGIHEKGKNYKDEVTLISKNGIKNDAILFLALHKDYGNSLLMIGLLSLIQDQKEYDNEIVGHEVLRLLKSENISISHSVNEKINGLFKAQNIKYSNQFNTFFSRRESEVLRLTIDGLPIKLIADKLDISNRTVEKHRASLMDKTGASNIVEVIIFALRNKLVKF